MSAVLSQVQPTFNIISKEEIEGLAPLIRDDIARALETSDGEATVEDTLAGLRRGTSTLALFIDGGAYFGVVYQLLIFPGFKIARVLLGFGKNMRGVQSALERGEQWAKSEGCKFVEGWVATPSRARLFSRFGYKPKYTILRKELT